jgi:hypothetical protein
MALSMKKPIFLSGVVAFSLYAKSSDIYVAQSNLNNWSGFAVSGGYQLYGMVGQMAVESFSNSQYRAVSGVITNPEDLNIAPDVNISTSVSLYEDGIINIPFSTFDAENDDLNITVTKNGSIGVASIVNETVQYIPYSNSSGSDSLTVLFDDGFGGVVERNISISVSAVDDAPTMGGLSPVNIDEDSESKTVQLSITDIDTSVSTAVIKATSTNSDIATVLTSGQSIVITPVAEKFGTASVTATATLGGKSVSQTFEITINPVDDEPLLADISDVVVDEDSESKTVQISLTDIDSDVAEAIYSIESSNPEIADVSISGNIITLTPKANMFGVSTVTVKASLDGKEVSTTFNYTLNPVDDSLILGGFENITNSGTGSISTPISIADIDSDVNSADISISSSNPELADISIVDGEVVITPKGNLSGSTEITVTATLDGKEVSQTFTYNSERVNTAPTVEAVENLELQSQTERFSETVSLVFSDDIGVESLNVTSSNQNLVSVSGDLESSELTLSISPDSVGEAVINIQVSDIDGEEASTTFKVVVKANESQVCLANSTTALTFDTIKGENSEQNYIRTHLNLPTTLESCDREIYLTWSSSNENIIDTLGNVYIDEEKDYTVKLTADIENDGFTSTKSFLLTVPKDELTDEIAVQQAFDVLTFEIIRWTNIKKSEIYSDLALPTEGVSDTLISWSSSNENIISIDGLVTRDVNDSAVILTAKISKNGETLYKEFYLNVKAKKDIDSEIVASDKLWLTVGQILNQNRDSDSIKTELTLYDTGINGSEISWSSSNEDIVSTSGAVTRDIKDRYVELVATLESGESIDAKAFLLTVMKIVEDVVENNVTFNRVEDIEGNETKTISMFLDSDLGEISSTVEIDNNISESIETIVSEESVKTLFETNSSLTTIYLNSDGTADTKVEFLDENNNSVESGLKVELSGGKTSLQSDGTIKASIDTKEAEVKPDGSVSHSVKSETGKSSVATSKLAGSSVNVSESGVKTTYESVSQNESGEKIILQATIDTDNSSKSKTSFSLTNLSTGEKIELDQTLSTESSFSEGTEIEIDKDSDGKIEITIKTKLSQELEIQ